MKKDYFKPFGDILKTEIPLDNYGAKGFDLTERLDFSGHRSGKVAPHLNTEITYDDIKIGRKYQDLTKIQLPGLNEYQYEGRKFEELKLKNLVDVNLQKSIVHDPVDVKIDLPEPVKPTFESDLNNSRINIDSNGYALGERTSAGYAPNALPDTIQPGGMPPLDLGKPVTREVTNTPIKGTSCNGYFAPNIDFMKP